MKVLALDPSTKSTGYAIYENKKLIQYGCIESSDTNMLNRIKQITTKLIKTISLSDIDEVIVEDPIPEEVGHNQSVYKALIYLQGQLALILNEYGLKMNFCTSSEWRKKCGIRTGRGVRRDTLKKQDILFVKDKFDLLVNDDVADAIGIGYAYCVAPQEGSAF